MTLAGIVLAAGLTLAGVDVGDGPASVTLEACPQGRSTAYIAGCSYVYLTGRGAPPYIYLGAVTWAGGSVSNRILTFPAAGQTWPASTGGTTTVTWRPAEITGAVEPDGTVSLALLYEMSINAPDGECRLNGLVGLTSHGTEPLGGQASGRPYDPATGRFAVVSTEPSPPLPSLNAACLRLAVQDYDLLKGASWYLTGRLQVPPGTPAPAPVTQREQTAVVDLPKRIAAKGPTVLLKRAVRTNAGQRAIPVVTWTGENTKRYASVRVGKRGKVTFTTTGKARRLRVSLTLWAPATDGYTAYSSTNRWWVKRRAGRR